MSQQPNLVHAPTMAMLTPADVLRIIRKRLWLIILCFVVIGGGGTAGLVAWWYLAPSFTAEGALEVEPGQNQTAAIGPGWQTEVPIALFAQYVQSQVYAVENPRVLSAALNELKDQQNLYVGPGGAVALALDLRVVSPPNTQNIFVSLRGCDKEQVQRIIKEVLTQYTEQLKTDRAQADADRQKELRLERDDLRKQLDDLGRRLSAYREESSVIITDERNSEQLTLLMVLIQQLAGARAALTESDTAWKQFQDLRKQAEEGKDLTPVLMAFPEVMDALRKDTSVTAMTEQGSRLAQDLSNLKQRFGQKHETVIRTQAALQAAQNDLQAKQSEILGQLFQQQAAILKSKYDRARATEADLLTRVAEARSAAMGAAKLTAEYRSREEDYHRVQMLLGTVTDGLERMRISSALARPNIHVVRWPDIPLDVSEPRLMLYIPAVLVFSILVGLGLSLLIELMDTRLRTPNEVIRQVGIPLLGSIPDLTEDERLGMDTNVALVSQTTPHSLLAEAFRQCRTNILFASDHPVKSILVTSPNPGDGKTMVSVNLATTMARSGARILLIEGNFRRPCLARVFDVPDAVGLSNVLVGLNSATEAIQATRVENLDVLVAGALPPSPAELLGSPSMKQLVRDMTQRYDGLIIDGAPMLVVTDNYLLAEAVDGVIMIFRAGENTRGLAQRAARQVLSLRARLLGGILNRVRATKGGYFRESFQAYYDYAGPACPTGPAGVKTKPAAAGPAVAIEDPPDEGGRKV